MFFNYLVTLGTIALLSMSGVGKPAVHLPTQRTQVPAQVQSSATSDLGQADNSQDSETQDKTDADNVQAGDLTDTTDLTDTAGITDSTEMTDEVHSKTEAGDTEHADEQKTGKDQAEGQNASDNSAETDKGHAEQDAQPTGKPAITAEAAQKTAEAYLKAGTASKVELDKENGKLVYSVQIANSDVKVDAMTGAVLSTETSEN